jgi:hypothetical protein
VALVPSRIFWFCGELVQVVRVVCEEGAGRLVCAPHGRNGGFHDHEGLLLGWQ